MDPWGSIRRKDEIISILNTYSTNNNIDLNVNVVNPGTTFSDHSRFWNQGYTAVLFGEAWSNNDQTEDYHTSGDRVSTLDLDYYHDMVKLSMAYMATKAGFATLSVDEFDSLGVSIYPNPIQSTLKIKFIEPITTAVEIVDLNGKVVQIASISNSVNSLDIAQLSSGVYFVNLKNRKGERTVKIIKE